ncbi:MAG: transporter [Chitinophagaceae bacterium]|nr:transporter [Chitinophagaceae bacterium]
MRRILPIIVISQFFCTSLWFAGNSILPDLASNLHLAPGFLANLTSAVQFGFMTGTFVFALLTVSDRFSPSKVFFTCSIIAALFNLCICIENIASVSLLVFRFFTGVFLAGIYPVGMKIASDYYQKGLGKSLGYLVGALVLGTAFPHLVKSITTGLPWKYVLFTTSGLSVAGGLGILLFIPDGPYRKAGQKLHFSAFLSGFHSKNFSAAAFGYFGHMWELYTFWAFVPVILAAYQSHFSAMHVNIPLLSFCIIAPGAIACVASGLLSQSFGTKNLAAVCLSLSGLCCILSPLFLFNPSFISLVVFLVCWGLFVIADSPLFSTLVAHNAPVESRGTSLTMVNCIGFSITIISIQLIKFLTDKINAQYIYIILAIGPVCGLIALLKKPSSE